MMKLNLVCFLVLIWGVMSCSHKISSNDPKYYFRTHKIRFIKHREVTEISPQADSICKAGYAAAEKDIGNKKLTYFHYAGGIEYHGNEEMNNLLSGYNIAVDTTAISCIISPYVQNCYERRMHQAINEQYGATFIDSLRMVATQQYLANNPEKVFIASQCDRDLRYPTDKKYDNTLKKNFLKSAGCPKNYRRRKDGERYSYITAEFTLHKNGAISDVVPAAHFRSKENEQFSNYYIDKMREFVLKNNWTPSTINGIAVNSKVELTVYVK